MVWLFMRFWLEKHMHDARASGEGGFELRGSWVPNISALTILKWTKVVVFTDFLLVRVVKINKYTNNYVSLSFLSLSPVELLLVKTVCCKNNVTN